MGKVSIAEQGVGEVKGTTDLDLSYICCDSTYAALSSCVKTLLRDRKRSINLLSRKELDLIVDHFENRKIDLTNLDKFPYDAPDLDECLFLLAKLQNRCALEGVEYQDCTIRDIIEDTLIDRENTAHRYNIGEWVEVRGPSMRWRLETITDVIKIKDGDGDEAEDTFIYETAVDHRLTESEIRWPREALKRTFGMRPWIWRQWACLRLEHKIRFQEGHPDDFETLDIRGYVQELWKCWLNDKRNKDFKELFERVGPSGQAELVDHLMSHFYLMHDVITDQDEKWNFEDAGVSIFTYVSIIGGGFMDLLVVICLQLSMPIFLYSFYTQPDEDQDSIAKGTRPMLFVVLVYYGFKVTRDLWKDNFLHIAGISDSVVSRIQSLRKIVWDHANDSLAQSLGYTVDLFMNTGYLCALYIFNVFILFNVSDPFEILGSVIFFEFLFDLDEEIAASSWYDDEKRFIKAGVVEMCMQTNIRRERMRTKKTWTDWLDQTLAEAEKEVVKKRLDEVNLPDDETFLLGEEDDEEIELLTIAERVERLRNSDSRSLVKGRNNLQDKEKVYFSLICNDSALFERHKDLYAWSHWEELLFLYPIPTMVPESYQRGTKLVLDDDIGLLAAQRKRRFAPGRTKNERFLFQVRDMLSCRTMVKDYAAAKVHRPWYVVSTRVFHSLFAWPSYAVQFVFPFIIFASLIVVYMDTWYCAVRRGESDDECLASISRNV